MGNNFPPSMVVEIKSPWFSKVNWTVGIGWLATLITAWLVPQLTDWGVPGAIVSFVTVATVTQGLTWMLNTFFRTTILSSSLPKT